MKVWLTRGLELKEHARLLLYFGVNYNTPTELIVFLSLNRYENNNTRSSHMEERGARKSAQAEFVLAVVPPVGSGSTAPSGVVLLQHGRDHYHGPQWSCR